MMELRWLPIPTFRVGAIVVNGEHRVLQYRHVELVRNKRDLGADIEWSEWTDVDLWASDL